MCQSLAIARTFPLSLLVNYAISSWQPRGMGPFAILIFHRWNLRSLEVALSKMEQLWSIAAALNPGTLIAEPRALTRSVAPAPPVASGTCRYPTSAWWLVTGIVRAEVLFRWPGSLSFDTYAAAYSSSPCSAPSCSISFSRAWILPLQNPSSSVSSLL